MGPTGRAPQAHLVNTNEPSRSLSQRWSRAGLGSLGMKDVVDFRVSARPLRPGSYLLAVEGELDLYTSPEVKELVRAIPDGIASLLVDLAAVSFVDSAGLGVLVGIAKRMRERGGAVTL